MNMVLQDIFVTFERNTLRETQAIKGINLNISREERITILGNNNVGKTTLLKLIAGRICPTFGNIFINGQNSVYDSLQCMSKYCFLISKDYDYNARSDLTILENIILATLPPTSKSLFKKAITCDRLNIIKDCIDRYGFLGIENALNRRVIDVQRFYIYALSLVIAALKRPKFLLIDNITFDLPKDISTGLIDIVKRIVQDQKNTLIAVMGNPKEEFDFFNRCIVMDDGKIHLDLSGDAKEKFDFSKIFDYFDIVPNISHHTANN